MVFLKIISIRGSSLQSEALPSKEIVIMADGVDSKKLEQFEQLIDIFNTEGDKLITEIFYPLHQNRQFQVQVVATSGIPAPYDAWTAIHQGRPSIFFNLDLWTIDQLCKSGIGVIKHEVAHILMEPLLRPPIQQNYIERLDYIVINEGIAHFIGSSKDSETLLNEKFEQWEESEKTLADALKELKDLGTPSETKELLLKQADTGPFWKKYGAISGMFRAAHVYSKLGSKGLTEAIRSHSLRKSIS